MSVLGAMKCGIAILSFYGYPADRASNVYEAAKYGSTNLMVMLAVESGYNQKAVSSVGAIGIGQITKIAKAQVYISQQDAEPACRNLPKLNRYRLKDNLKLSYCYYSYLTKLSKGSTILSVAGYNGGPSTWNRITKGLSINSETANYVTKFYFIKERIRECRY